MRRWREEEEDEFDGPGSGSGSGSGAEAEAEAELGPGDCASYAGGGAKSVEIIKLTSLKLADAVNDYRKWEILIRRTVVFISNISRIKQQFYLATATDNKIMFHAAVLYLSSRRQRRGTLDGTLKRNSLRRCFITTLSYESVDDQVKKMRRVKKQGYFCSSYFVFVSSRVLKLWPFSSRILFV